MGRSGVVKMLSSTSGESRCFQSDLSVTGTRRKPTVINPASWARGRIQGHTDAEECFNSGRCRGNQCQYHSAHGDITICTDRNTDDYGHVRFRRYAETDRRGERHDVHTGHEFPIDVTVDRQLVAEFDGASPLTGSDEFR